MKYWPSHSCTSPVSRDSRSWRASDVLCQVWTSSVEELVSKCSLPWQLTRSCPLTKQKACSTTSHCVWWPQSKWSQSDDCSKLVTDVILLVPAGSKPFHWGDINPNAHFGLTFRLPESISENRSFCAKHFPLNLGPWIQNTTGSLCTWSFYFFLEVQLWTPVNKMRNKKYRMGTRPWSSVSYPWASRYILSKLLILSSLANTCREHGARVFPVLNNSTHGWQRRVEATWNNNQGNRYLKANRDTR